MEQINHNLLFRGFVGLGIDDAVWNHAAFSKNRESLLNSAVAQRFFAAVNKQARRFMSDEHFTVDGTLIQVWASQKSFRPKDGSGGSEARIDALKGQPNDCSALFPRRNGETASILQKIGSSGRTRTPL